MILPSLGGLWQATKERPVIVITFTMFWLGHRGWRRWVPCWKRLPRVRITLEKRDPP